MEVKKENITLVVEQIVNMLNNNYIKENKEFSCESLIDWCEFGDLFYNMNNLQENDRKECIEIMNNLNGYVQNLTNYLYIIYNNAKENKEKEF